MDGFVVRAADTPGTLPIVARVAAGRPAPRPLAPGEAMAIATGGVVPDGADSVVPIEVVTESDSTVAVAGSVARGDNVRDRGGDLRAGDVVVEAGAPLGPAHLGALAAAGGPPPRGAEGARAAGGGGGDAVGGPRAAREPCAAVDPR